MKLREALLSEQGMRTDLSNKEIESLHTLLKYHGTKDDVTSKASWGTHCKKRFKKLTGVEYSEEAARRAWDIIDIQ